jgi:hypothetical protein
MSITYRAFFTFFHDQSDIQNKSKSNDSPPDQRHEEIYGRAIIGPVPGTMAVSA